MLLAAELDQFPERDATNRDRLPIQIAALQGGALGAASDQKGEVCLGRQSGAVQLSGTVDHQL